MKSFHTVAVPHSDILEGRLTMDVFAADLWEAYHNRGPAEYKDASLFFQKTYMTQGLQNLLSIIHKRIQGKGGDSTIQIQTPFGGGKTHSLIAIMHKAKEWNARCPVIVGTNLQAKNTLWSIIETQLTGKNEKLTGLTSPGKDALKALLEHHQPLIILMDEVLEYITKAAGVLVGESTLAAQTFAFMQELTEVVSILPTACLVVTLPSSLLEHYDKNAEQFFAQLQKVMGRVEKIYTPVEDKEIAKVIRQRLFSFINENEVYNIAQSFVEYCTKENILPAGKEPTEYRDRFIDSYPFLPEVIDVLYQRWGSFPTFQRTRGVLRILSIVINYLKNSSLPYISLADFDLDNQDLRQELLKHIGAEYNSIIAQDITSPDSGSRKVDNSLGEAYKGLLLASRAATVAFMYSFSGAKDNGATLTEIKRSATTLNNPSSVVAESVEHLKSKLFYFQIQNDKYFFSNQPNLNRIVITKMENITDKELNELEFQLLKKTLIGNHFKVFVWQENSIDIPDNEDLKLVVLKNKNMDLISSILKSKGNIPRINCNTVFFLVPLESERNSFNITVKKYIAYKEIQNDKSLQLTAEQQKEIQNELKKLESEVNEIIRRLYRNIIIPIKENFKEEDLGIPTYGMRDSFINEIFNKLKHNNDITEKLSPLVIKERYLGKNKYISTQQMAHAFHRTPGEPRLVNRSVLSDAISEGVEKGIFGLGVLHDNNIKCEYYKEKPNVVFAENEIIISSDECERIRSKEESKIFSNVYTPYSNYDNQQTPLVHESQNSAPAIDTKNRIHLIFELPKGKANDVLKMVNLLHTYFNSISLEIKATGGSMTQQEYEMRIQEALKQLGIEYKEH